MYLIGSYSATGVFFKQLFGLLINLHSYGKLIRMNEASVASEHVALFYKYHVTLDYVSVIGNVKLTAAYYSGCRRKEIRH